MKALKNWCLMLLAIFMMDGSAAYAQPQGPTQQLLLEARLTPGGPLLRSGVEWRIYRATIQSNERPEPLASSTGGTKSFRVSPGTYLVHAAYGHAGSVKRIEVGTDEPARGEFMLNAGGLRLDAHASGNVLISQRHLRFDVYERRIRENGSRKLLARNLKAREVVAFPVGFYHVVSRFGKLNATTRADLKVEAGRLTDASLEHRAAIITFRLVRSLGGDAVADTSWSILTENGEVIRESTSTFPNMVLAEGNYTAIARHSDKVYSHDFKVRSGFNEDVEVLVPE